MHTSRLRKKVEQADPGTYGNLNESFVSVGTALPSLASSSKKDLNDYKPVWEQEVFDEQGRKRLHGAFTGGFSAGYFNTVGSKEGE
jgi:G patch domain-containing protein 1